MYFSIFAEDTPNSLEKRKVIREAHIKRLEELDRHSRLLTAGPLFKSEPSREHSPEMQGSLIIADFDNLADAKAWAAADPYATAEIWARITIYPYTVVFPNE